MAKIVRHRAVKIHSGDEEQEVRLKKWSAAKLFFLVREFWAMIEEALESFGSKEEVADLSEMEVVRRVIQSLLQADKQAAKLIRESIDEPEGLTIEGIMEWDADDFVATLTEVVDMNLSEELIKNFRKLLTTFQEKQARGKKKTPEPEPVAASTA